MSILQELENIKHNKADSGFIIPGELLDRAIFEIKKNDLFRQKEEIVKILRICGSKDCRGCEIAHGACSHMSIDAADLIELLYEEYSKH